MPFPAASCMSEEDFFNFLRTQDKKWELIRGKAVILAGRNQRHRDITANTLTSLYAQLREKRCRATAVDTGICTSQGTVRYPDVVVDCGLRDDQAMLATEPAVVIDVLSPSTNDFDSHRKVLEYKAKPEIAHILLIDTNDVGALLHYRDADGWCETMYASVDDVIGLPKIGATLRLRDVYFGLEF